ncbi:unnamed protein product [Cuscuta europaea]|uniref:Uncharacterized protein n=1 Tax=Cuscuta europaea TaxID=41803 RepID=A0A9P0Z1Z2_CUSEU|nr:unnamed protein product [Cuscuta europaea]
MFDWNQTPNLLFLGATRLDNVLRASRYLPLTPHSNSRDKGKRRAAQEKESKRGRRFWPQGELPVRWPSFSTYISSFAHPKETCEVPAETSRKEESIGVRFEENGAV